MPDRKPTLRRQLHKKAAGRSEDRPVVRLAAAAPVAAAVITATVVLVAAVVAAAAAAQQKKDDNDDPGAPAKTVVAHRDLPPFVYTTVYSAAQKVLLH